MPEPVDENRETNNNRILALAPSPKNKQTNKNTPK